MGDVAPLQFPIELGLEEARVALLREDDVAWLGRELVDDRAAPRISDKDISCVEPERCVLDAVRCPLLPGVGEVGLVFHLEIHDRDPGFAGGLEQALRRVDRSRSIARVDPGPVEHAAP